jgi:hypothetical protein
MVVGVYGMWMEDGVIYERKAGVLCFSYVSQDVRQVKRARDGIEMLRLSGGVTF